MSSDIVVKNISEDLVDMYLDECIENSGVCGCDRCRADVKALALNNIPTHYAVSEMGKALQRARILCTQYQTDIIFAIMNAALIVKENPKHMI